MIQIIHGANSAANRHALESMFEDRKRLFVDLLGWDVPVVGDRFEIDQFDDARAIYLVTVDAQGDHMGSLRLLPSERPHILGTLFASLCAKDVPTGAEIFEITRLCLPTRLGAVERLHIRNRLISAMVDHALASGIEMLTGVVEASFRNQILTMGWRAEALGPAMTTGGKSFGAFCIHVDAETPDRLRWAGVYRDGAGEAANPSHETVA